MTQPHTFVSPDQTLLNVDVAGEGEPVVFLHGLCGDAGQTAETFPAAPGFRRVTVEARGHGQSQAGDLERLSIATFADDVAAYVEQYLRAPIVIGGISMGASISLRLAVTRPDLVRGLIIARPAWITARAPENMAPNAEVGRLLRELPPEEAKVSFLAGDVGRRLAKEAPDNLASLAGFFARQPIEVTASLLTAISQDGPGVSEAEVRNLSVPTLVIGHELDVIHPLSYAQLLAGMIPAARFAQITPKVEDRARYVADFRLSVSNFLKDLSK
ncbi:putative non-heme bromoperoxidase BpoC [Ensifer adhaerens]|uniref:alpha/beta fold hydrolase n=1 Tax=Ensifer adhaerens TaxID=106592 RepID=UPI001569253E|nr:alpha/beta hydrolase [Ensifer adhaerens]NRP21750.1 putative non-heme bromoperoxidase BpoC [Ensifer adhaerens]